MRLNGFEGYRRGVSKQTGRVESDCSNDYN